jgi:hypothetical protein
MKRILLSIGMLMGLLVGITPSANAAVLNDQIITSDLILTKSGSPYQIKGIVQIPKGLKLVINPGAKVDIDGGGIVSRGEIIIGEEGSSDRVKFSLPKFFSGIDSKGGKVSIFSTDITGQEGSSLFRGCESAIVNNSQLFGVKYLVTNQECLSLSITNSFFLNVSFIYEGVFDGHPVFFNLERNVFVGMERFCCSMAERTMGEDFYGPSEFKVQNNTFVGLTEYVTPYRYSKFVISQNNFIDIKQIRATDFFVDQSRTEVLSSNYWGGAKTEDEIRQRHKVIDSKTNITLPRALIFSPILENPVSISGYGQTAYESYLVLQAQSKSEAKAAAEATLKSYQAKSETLKKLNSEIELWLSQYPNFFQANPFLRSGLIKGLDYIPVTSPTQKDVDEIAALIGGDAGWVGILSLKLDTEVLIKKYLADEALKLKTLAKKTTITCVKGKLTKKVTAVKPKCPTGYKLKK